MKTKDEFKPIRSRMGQSCDSAYIYGKRAHGPSGRLVVKEPLNPGKPLEGMIILDGGSEANRLWNLANPKPILRKRR